MPPADADGFRAIGPCGSTSARGYEPVHHGGERNGLHHRPPLRQALVARDERRSRLVAPPTSSHSAGPNGAPIGGPLQFVGRRHVATQEGLYGGPLRPCFAAATVATIPMPAGGTRVPCLWGLLDLSWASGRVRGGGIPQMQYGKMVRMCYCHLRVRVGTLYVETPPRNPRCSANPYIRDPLRGSFSPCLRRNSSQV